MDFYLNTARGEGQGTCWARTGTVHYQLDSCNLCQTNTCDDPEYTKLYADGIWYLDLGITTRYSSVSTAEQQLTYKNPMCLRGAHAVVHLGSTSMNGADQYLVFERVHLHRVLEEFRMGRNSLRVEAYASGRGDLSSFRARWNTKPMCGGSPLFHRWLLLPGANTSVYKGIEHLNDIALDCRAANLKVARNLVDNNNTTHRLSRAFREGEGEFERCAKRLRAARDEYHVLVESCPPLPDCVFKAKRFSEEKS